MDDVAAKDVTFVDLEMFVAFARTEHFGQTAAELGVSVAMNSKASTVTGKVDPQTGLDAKFSLTHGVAAPYWVVLGSTNSPMRPQATPRSLRCVS